MNRANIIVTAIVVAIIGSYFGYLGYKKSQDRENVFTQASKVKMESLTSDNRNNDLFIYGGSTFSMFMLPDELQKKIKIEKIQSHMKIQAMLKDYLVRLHVYAKDPKITVAQADPNKVPPLIEMVQDRVKNEVVEDIYNKNIEKLPKDHDPLDIKTQIRVNLLSQEALKFVRVFLTEIYYEKSLEFSAFPAIPEKWLKTPVNLSLSKDPKPFRLTWIGRYGCEKCEQYNTDIGLILDKYGKDNLNITFIPYTKQALNVYQQINLAALCYKEIQGQDEFWKFHALAMSESSKIKSLTPNDYKSSKYFVNLVLKSLGHSQDKGFLKEFNKCAYNLKIKENPVFADLVSSQKKIKNFSDFSDTTFLLNGRILDLEGRRLIIALEQFLNESEGN